MRACYFSLVSALDKNPDTKYKAYNHLKHRHDRIYVGDLPAAQELLAFFETANGRVPCHHKSLSGSSRRFSMSKMDGDASLG